MLEIRTKFSGEQCECFGVSQKQNCQSTTGQNWVKFTNWGKDDEVIHAIKALLTYNRYIR